MGAFTYSDFLDDAVVPSVFESPANEFFSLDIFNDNLSSGTPSLFTDSASCSQSKFPNGNKMIPSTFPNNVLSTPSPQMPPLLRGPSPMLEPSMPNASSFFSSNTSQGQGMLRLNFKDVMDAVDNTRKTSTKPHSTSGNSGRKNTTTTTHRPVKSEKTSSDRVTTNIDKGDTVSSCSDATQAVRNPASSAKVDAQKSSPSGNISEEGETMKREDRVARYRLKRKTRTFAVKVRYHIRKLNAERRPRLKGRFVKAEELQQMSQAQVQRLMEPHHYPTSYMDALPYI